jgi:hypothetical protein
MDVRFVGLRELNPADQTTATVNRTGGGAVVHLPTCRRRSGFTLLTKLRTRRSGAI